MNKIIIKCPTYKEAFTLRRALIELGINWRYGDINDLITWKEYWENYKDESVYFIKNNVLTYDGISKLNPLKDKKYSDWFFYGSVEEFIKKIISYKYEK